MKFSFAMCALLIVVQAVAVTVEVIPSKDNTLYETDTGNTSNGAGDRLFIGKTGSLADNRLRRALLQFDLSGINPNATIDAVSLELRVTNANSGIGGTATLHMVLSDWGEAGSIGSGNGGSAQTDDATWLHRYYATSDWNNPGGDYANMASGSAAFGTSNTETITFATSMDLVVDVQLWVSDPNSNHGWMIKGDELNDQNARGLASREYGIESVRPKLIIDFTLPENIFSNGFEP